MKTRNHILFRLVAALSIAMLMGPIVGPIATVSAQTFPVLPPGHPGFPGFPPGFPVGPVPIGLSGDMCALDRNNDGYVDGVDERADCYASTEGPTLCAIDAVNCVPDGSDGWTCPTDPDAACVTTDISRTTPKCSANACVTPTGPAEVVPDRPVELYQDDGARDGNGTCLAAVMIFSGRALDCRPPGVATTFMNCCKNRGKII
ncbi:MAG: hypothetical protein AAF862_14420, partial [Pseudomonadota bacterium]